MKGDEFVIIYANVTREQAVSFAEELRRRDTCIRNGTPVFQGTSGSDDFAGNLLGNPAQGKPQLGFFACSR